MKESIFRRMFDKKENRIFVPFLAIAMLWGCTAFARTVRTEPSFRILPRCVSHIRVTKFDHVAYVLRFVYDEQGRIVSVMESDAHEDAKTTTVEYDEDRMTVTDPTSKFVYDLADGRAVSMEGSWSETMEFSGCCTGTFSYDEAGYLIGRTYRNDADVEYENIFTIVDGCLDGWKRLMEGEELEMTNENDSARLNNLNIDLFGLSEFTFYEVASGVRLYGIGGERVRTLPVRTDCRWLQQSDAPEYRTYSYRMEGEYISHIEIRNECGERIHLDFFYEE
ncbi:MAG: hypothetical protein K2G58_06385 [Alistipes sp.]|nr:hypothetical protein [Alistipes sp.]